MPFRAPYPHHDGSHDFHKQHSFHGGQPQLAIVDPDSLEYRGWHEMDFTTTPLNSSTTSSAPPQKYPANMDTDVDSLAYLRSSGHRQNSTASIVTVSSHHHQHHQHQHQHQSPEAQTTLSGDLYSTGPFSYSQLLNMDAEISPMDESSLSSSRTDGDSNMLNDDNTGLTLSGTDSINTSPPIASLNPIAISLSSKSDPSEKLCPLIAGQVDSCQPQRCGPDAPCMNFTTLPPIEECTSVPCITGSTSSPNEAMITSESVSVPLHQRPSMSSRTSTATTAHSRRRSSASSNENQTQIQSVPLPPRRSTTAAAAARRRARNSTTTSAATTTVGSDEDEDEQQTTTKSTAPSKADAKQRAKQAHSLVEKKYRENLNAKIAQLHNTLQSSHYGPKTGEEGDSDVPESVVPASKVRKSDVLTEAMNYVNQTEVEMRHMENEIQRLSERVRVLEKLVRCEDCSLLKQMVNMQVQPV